MSVINSFVQRRDAQQKQEEQTPFKEGMCTHQPFSPSQLSAITFIALYEGIDVETLDELAETFFYRCKQGVGQLIEQEVFEAQERYQWQLFGQRKEAFTTIPLVLDDPRIHNHIYHASKQSPSLQQVNKYIINSYVQEFFQHINERKSNLYFPTKTNVLRRETTTRVHKELCAVILAQTQTDDFLVFGDAHTTDKPKILSIPLPWQR